MMTNCLSDSPSDYSDLFYYSFDEPQFSVIIFKAIEDSLNKTVRF